MEAIIHTGYTISQGSFDLRKLNDKSFKTSQEVKEETIKLLEISKNTNKVSHDALSFEKLDKIFTMLNTPGYMSKRAIVDSIIDKSIEEKIKRFEELSEVYENEAEQFLKDNSEAIDYSKNIEFLGTYNYMNSPEIYALDEIKCELAIMETPQYKENKEIIEVFHKYNDPEIRAKIKDLNSSNKLNDQYTKLKEQVRPLNKKEYKEAVKYLNKLDVKNFQAIYNNLSNKVDNFTKIFEIMLTEEYNKNVIDINKSYPDLEEYNQLLLVDELTEDQEQKIKEYQENETFIKRYNHIGTLMEYFLQEDIKEVQKVLGDDQTRDQFEELVIIFKSNKDIIENINKNTKIVNKETYVKAKEVKNSEEYKSLQSNLVLKHRADLLKEVKELKLEELIEKYNNLSQEDVNRAKEFFNDPAVKICERKLNDGLYEEVAKILESSTYQTHQKIANSEIYKKALSIINNENYYNSIKITEEYENLKLEINDKEITDYKKKKESPSYISAKNALNNQVIKQAEIISKNAKHITDYVRYLLSEYSSEYVYMKLVKFNIIKIKSNYSNISILYKGNKDIKISELDIKNDIQSSIVNYFNTLNISAPYYNIVDTEQLSTNKCRIYYTIKSK